MSNNSFFPVFVDSKDKSAIVIGGGKIASRRIGTLIKFDFDIKVVSPEITEEIEEYVSNGRVEWIESRFEEAFIQDAFIVLACTDDRNVNHDAGIKAKKSGILVSVCDARDESTFWFPAIAKNEQLTVGLVGSGEEHETTRKAAAELRKIIDGKAY